MTVVPFYGTPSDMTPALFSALTPDLQTLAILLMRERDAPASLMMRATGLTQRDLDRCASARHCVMIGAGPERMAEDCVVEASRRYALPVNAARALVWLHAQGGEATISHQALEENAGLGIGTAQTALPWLITAGHLDRLGASHRNVASTYQVTPTGKALAAHLTGGAAA
ncbi:hypothetical protein [Rhizobium straminoryzae]|uniref:Uncharacterized protein n=1 Tax=Rhizobium straminoryzae TaxID=1387186 RepID=A0A549T0V7_9HYPH|nr:hypothetical protein [Rhizobium straminoryzae]TRL35512.1 hypothetical protein FNA46_20145 [Rhizobium straminoryzae]